MSFTLSELATLIRLVEKEENELHALIRSDNEQVSDDASDRSIQVGKLAGKLKELYESQWSEGSNHPEYGEVIKLL